MNVYLVIIFSLYELVKKFLKNYNDVISYKNECTIFLVIYKDCIFVIPCQVCAKLMVIKDTMCDIDEASDGNEMLHSNNYQL